MGERACGNPVEHLQPLPDPSRIETQTLHAVTENRPFILQAAAALLLSATGASGAAQTPAAPAPSAAPAQAFAVPAVPKAPPNFYRNLIVIDPAHGGPDRGAQLSDGAAEKEVVLAFAQRLRPALAAQGFTVVSTRDSDPVEVLSSDQRAGTANHTRPLACLLLHATESGSGIHIATSSLQQGNAAASRALHWSDAQAGSVAMSLRLANEIGLAMLNANLPVVLLRASVPPADNLTCAAAVIEVAPLAEQNGRRSSANAGGVSDAGYQQRVAEAIAQGLASFRTRNAPAPVSSAVPQAPVRTAPAAPAVPVAPVAPRPGAAPASGAPKPQAVPEKPGSTPEPRKGGEPR